ncbi:hypothetical protein [Pantoea sp. Mhis]|uniref:hypothetical protein n=1 Tax=Pantoea sp. Mhis TaxID=2576759 RepID=UPI00135C7577|nr:hypothetical protein [Pantoea sp. Mhis]
MKGIKQIDFNILGNLQYKTNNILGVIIPKKIYREKLSKLMLVEDFSIEISTYFGLL